MTEELIQLDSRRVSVRILTTLGLLAALTWSWFAVRWYVGDTIAEYLTPEDSSLKTAQLAVSLAPNDPLAHWQLAEVSRQRLPPDQLAEAVREYEKAVTLSPNDYRFWMSLGTALEQAGDRAQAETVLRRSIELAPSYSYPAWYLGNLLLRSGRLDEAFAELRRASESDPQLRPQLFNLAWEVYSEDFPALKAAVGATAAGRSQFALYLLGRQRFDDGLRLWDSLNQQEKRANRESGVSIIRSLLTARRFHEALLVSNDLVSALSSRATVGQITDAGFEDEVAPPAEADFSWQVKSAPQMHIGIDPNEGHGGGRSLRLVFQVRSRIDAINVSQLVAVLPGTEYDLEYYVKTEKLESAATPLVEVDDANDDSLIIASPAAPAGNTDWQVVRLTFRTGAKSQGIRVRLVRASCGENTVCPIFGTVWYDDFNLKRRS